MLFSARRSEGRRGGVGDRPHSCGGQDTLGMLLSILKKAIAHASTGGGGEQFGSIVSPPNGPNRRPIHNKEN